MISSQRTQPAASSQQLDLFSYTAPAAAPSQPAASAASIGRTLRAGTWMPASLVRGALIKANSTMLQLVIDWMMEEDSGETVVYEFGAREMRRLFEDVPATSQIRITDNPDEARAIIVEIRSEGSGPNARMRILDGAWHKEPAAKLPAKKHRWTMGDEAYTAAYSKALAERQKTIAAKTIRVTLLAQ